MTISGPNAEFIQCWNDILSPKFQRYREVLVTGFKGHSDPVVAAHGPAPGERVIDVGCGWGDTTIELARRVGPGGEVLGVDVVEDFLAEGRRAAAAAGLGNVRFLCADAQTEPLEPGWDLIFARFGTMFFASPVTALRNLGTATRPGARLAILVWRSLDENGWAATAKRIALAHLPPPDDAAATCGPGPFSMADPVTVRAILDAAGWRDPEWQAIDAPIRLGTLDESVTFQMLLGPAGEIVREAGERGAEQADAIAAELRQAMAPWVDADGVVAAPSASWCVTARWP
jgi:ubiquinone/menaquinone biosynthesis C-methylase UbiE